MKDIDIPLHKPLGLGTEFLAAFASRQRIERQYMRLAALARQGTKIVHLVLPVAAGGRLLYQGEPKRRQFALALGRDFVGPLSKPVSFSRLLDLVCRLLRNMNAALLARRLYTGSSVHWGEQKQGVCSRELTTVDAVCSVSASKAYRCLQTIGIGDDHPGGCPPGSRYIEREEERGRQY